jgi:uncharacterized protein YbaP (TraB family)
VLAVALALALLSTGCKGPPPVEARPALWRVRDADTTIWLLGTIHVLPANVRWQTDAVREAIETSDALVLELPDDPDGTAAAFARASRADGLPTVTERVPSGRKAALEAAAAAAHVTLDTLSGMKTWAAALAIASGANQAEGASRDNGLEAVLAERFKARGKRLGALETAAGQFAAFDALPEPAQRVLLDRAIDAAAHASADYRTTLAAWAAGDERRIAATIDPALRAAPALEDALVTRRNARWAAAIMRRMAAPGRVLVAVGVGHLVGARSVPAMLRARGMKVERVE